MGQFGAPETAGWAPLMAGKRALSCAEETATQAAGILILQMLVEGRHLPHRHPVELQSDRAGYRSPPGSFRLLFARPGGLAR